MKLPLVGLCLILLICSFFVSFADVKADTSDQVPAPNIGTRTIASGTAITGGSGGVYLGGYAMGFNHGADFNSEWQVAETNDAQNGLGLGWQGNSMLNISGTEFLFQFTLGSSSTGGVSASHVYVNCSGEVIPMYLYNCSSYDMSTSSITYVDNDTIPTFTNTITFHNIAIETYGQGDSSISLTFTQHFIANSTQLTVKTETYADLSNMTLYYSDHSAVPQGTAFSFNLDYMVCLINQTETDLTSQPAFIYPTNITQTAMYFDANDTGGMQYSVADLSLADNYTELQGNTQITNKTATAYFSPGWASGCVCIQSFNNLTYGVTTAISSDPTVDVQHSKATASSNNGNGNGGANTNWAPEAIVGGIITIAVIIIAVVATVFVRKKRRHNAAP